MIINLNQVFKKEFEDNRFQSWEDFKTYSDEVLYIYKQVLNGERKFPKDFWKGEDGLINARIILDFLEKNEIIDISKFPKNARTVLRLNKLGGIVDYYQGKSVYEFVNNLYPGRFSVAEFARIDWENNDTQELAKEIIRFELNKEMNKLGCKSLEDLYNIKITDWYNNGRLRKAVKIGFNGNIVDALNYAYYGEFTFQRFRFVTLRTKFKDVDYYEMIKYILERDNKKINELSRNDLKEFKVSLPNKRFKTLDEIKRFYKKYKTMCEQSDIYKN